LERTHTLHTLAQAPAHAHAHHLVHAFPVQPRVHLALVLARFALMHVYPVLVHTLLVRAFLVRALLVRVLLVRALLARHARVHTLFVPTL